MQILSRPDKDNTIPWAGLRLANAGTEGDTVFYSVDYSLCEFTVDVLLGKMAKKIYYSQPTSNTNF